MDQQNTTQPTLFDYIIAFLYSPNLSTQSFAQQKIDNAIGTGGNTNIIELVFVLYETPVGSRIHNFCLQKISQAPVDGAWTIANEFMISLNKGLIKLN